MPPSHAQRKWPRAVAEPRKIMMAVDEPGAVRQMEVEALRHINEALTVLTADMRDARERLIRIESNQLDRTVQSHATRLDALEREKDRRDGATGIIATLWKSPVAGWLALLAGGAWAVLTGRIHS